jgi:hypothetical protein
MINCPPPLLILYRRFPTFDLTILQISPLGLKTSLSSVKDQEKDWKGRGYLESLF